MTSNMQHKWSITMGDSAFKGEEFEDWLLRIRSALESDPKQAADLAWEALSIVGSESDNYHSIMKLIYFECYDVEIKTKDAEVAIEYINDCLDDHHKRSPEYRERQKRHEQMLDKHPKISSADNLSQEILRLVQEDPAARTIVEELSPYGDIFVVGGAPRDVVLGKQPKDIDMMARIDGKIIKEVLGQIYDSQIILTGKQFPVYRFKYEGSEVEIALPRTEEKIPGGGNKDWKFVSDPAIPVEEDLRRRDFTVNAIAVNAKTGEVHDPFGGIQDLEKLQLKTVSDTSFRDDTSRVMRALTQMAKHGIIPDDTTNEQMRQYAVELNKAAPELIQMELDKIMKAGNPHLAIRLAYETGVLKEFLPEVEATFGFDQKSKYHDYELGDHLLAVLEATLKHDDPDLRLAALLHDIGKPGSQWIDEEGFGHFYKKQMPDGTFQGEQHEQLGADMAAARMKELHYPNANIDEVEFLIRNHMFPVFQNAKGARKFLQNAGSYERAKKLLALREADLTGKGPNAPEGTPADVALMHQLLDEAHENQVAVSLKDLAINGRDLVAMGIEGPEIGRKLKALLEEVIADPELNNRETLLQMAKTASPVEADWFQAWIAKNGPYLYHYTDPMDVPSILRKGLLKTRVGELGGFWKPRQGYVYLATEAFFKSKFNTSLMNTPQIRVNISELDPAKFATDEDSLLHVEDLFENTLPRYEDDLGQFYKTEAPSERYYPNQPGLGVWMDRNLEYSFPPYSHRSLENYGAIAYYGSIPPKLIDLNPRVDKKYYSATIDEELQIPEGPPMPRRQKFTIDTDAMLVRAVAHILENGGGTFDPHTLEPVELPGYFVSIEGQEQKFPDSALTPRILGRYLDDHSWAWRNPDHYLGAWIDEGICYLDVTRFFEDREEAVTFGRDNNQRAIYDSIKDEVFYIEDQQEEDGN